MALFLRHFWYFAVVGGGDEDDVVVVDDDDDCLSVCLFIMDICENGFWHWIYCTFA